MGALRRIGDRLVAPGASRGELLVVDATAAAKRRFHGPGRGPRGHLGFVVAHVQPFALAWFAPVLLVKLLLGHLLPGEAAPRGDL